MRKDAIKTMILLHKNAERLSEAYHLAALAHASIDLSEGCRDPKTFEELMLGFEKMDDALVHLNKAIVNSISFYEQQTGDKFTFKP